jgi:hypothetical protein
MKIKSFTLLTFFVGLALICGGCEKLDIEKGTSKCVKNRIEDFNKSDLSCNDASVDQYTFQGKTVYTFDPGSCGADMQTEVIDENCKTLGYLGGILGNTYINGEHFSNATFVKRIWGK